MFSSEKLSLLWEAIGQHPFSHNIFWGLAIAIGLLLIPNCVWRRIGKLPGLTPNWFTIWRMPVTYFGMYWYFYIDCTEGFYIIVFSFVMDRIDGKIAKAIGRKKPLSKTSSFKEFWDDMNYAGVTETGKWLDPLVDKFAILPMLIIFGVGPLLFLPFILVIVFTDVVSTLMRIRFDFIQEWVPKNWPKNSWKAKWTLRWAKCMQRLISQERGASGLGKLKMILQLIVLIMCHPFYQGWFTELPWTLNLLLGGTVLFAVLSVASRIKWWGRLAWMNGVIRVISRQFQH